MPSAVVMGVGPLDGLGAELCRRFAKRGLHVYLAGRTRQGLEELAAVIESEGGSARASVADATDTTQVRELFMQAAEDGPLALAIYNVGNNRPGRIAEMEVDYFVESWRSGCLGGFLFAREAVQHMLPEKQGTLLFTGASASLRGRANFGAFNSAKAALRSMTQALAKEVGPAGIHVAHVIIDGAINGEKIKTRYPEYAEKLGAEGMVDLKGIVDAYEFLHDQGRAAWTFELDLRTAIENW